VVVLLIDELEALKSLGNAALQKVMTALRALRDSFSKVASAQGYPSIAFIAASTGSFFEEITQLEPALSSRWSDKGIPLNSALSDIEFEYLARELRSLYKRADWQLRSLGDNDIPLLREEVNGQLAKEQKIGNMREVIKRIMDYIEDHWQR
jgi:hypothetical protein